MDELRNLYQEVILEHNRKQRYHKHVDGADHSVEGYNPLCGDRYTVELRMEGDAIGEIGFSGSGCAISRASASIMCEAVEGKSREEVQDILDRFSDIVSGSLDASGGILEHGAMAALAGVREFPMRVKCATLPWHTLRAALEGQDDFVTTE